MTKVDGSTMEAAACEPGEKSAIEYGLNPGMGPLLPSSPTITVPAGGGAPGVTGGPDGVIGGGSPGGVHPVMVSRPASTAASRRARRPTPAPTRRTHPTLRTPTPHLLRDRCFARSVP